MKPKSPDAFIKAIPKTIRAVLIYGPDQGMVRERAEMVGKSVVSDLSDPFNVSDITPDRLTEDKALLMDEMASQSLMGGRRLVRLRGATDYAAPAIAAVLNDPPATDTLLLVEGGELRPSAKGLRDLFEKSEIAAALACYEASAQELIKFASEQFRAAGVTITQDGNTLLASLLASDRGVARGEIEKLILYAGAGKKLDYDDVAAAIGNSASLDFDAAGWAAGAGDFVALDRALDRLFAEGTATIAILRSAQRHFLRLYEVVGSADPVGVALKALRPPVFWKDEDRFRAQAESWKPARVEDALQKLLQAELDCKRTGYDDQLMCSRALMSIAGMNKSRERAA